MEAFLQRGGPLSALDLRILLPPAKHLYHVLIIIPGTAHIVILMGHAALHILRGKRDEGTLLHLSVFPIHRHAGSRSGLHRHLRPAVPIKIIHHKLGIMRARPDVYAHVQPPQKPSVQLVAVDIAFPGIAFDGDITGIGGIPFHIKLIFPVSVRIPHAHVVGAVGVGLPGRRDSALRLLKRELQIAVLIFHRTHRLAAFSFFSITDGRHLVTAAIRSLRVHITGTFRHDGEPLSVPVYRVIRPAHAALRPARNLIEKHPPGEKYAVLRFQRHKTPVQPFQLRLYDLLHRRFQDCAFPGFSSIRHLPGLNAQIVRNMG